MTDIDVEIGRYALRTFRTNAGRLQTVAWEEWIEAFEETMNGSWNGGWCNGTCEAQCLRMAGILTGLHPLHRTAGHSPPHRGCTCGIYGTVNLSSLLRDYSCAREMVAVIAAEGPTIIGSTGLRTAAARVVAYWVRTRTVGRICRRDLGDADEYHSLNKMIKAYGLTHG